MNSALIGKTYRADQPIIRRVRGGRRGEISAYPSGDGSAGRLNLRYGRASGLVGARRSEKTAVGPGPRSGVVIHRAAGKTVYFTHIHAPQCIYTYYFTSIGTLCVCVCILYTCGRARVYVERGAKFARSEGDEKFVHA